MADDPRPTEPQLSSAESYLKLAAGFINNDSADSDNQSKDGDDDEMEWMDAVGSDQEFEDEEITAMLDGTRDARERLKTGDLEELARDFQEFEDNLITTSGIGKTRHGSRKRITKGEMRIPEEAKQILGKANALYIAQDHGQAIDLLQDLITRFPNLHQAWNTLGLIHEEIGNTERALRLRMVAAHMNQKDAGLWKELGVKSVEADAIQQAIYCFTKALAINPMDVDALWDRSFLLKQMNRNDDAMDGFHQILEILPHHFKVLNELVKLHRSKGQTKEAIAMYEEAFKYHLENPTPPADDANEEDEDFADRLGYTEINMLSELYLMENDYARSLECIKSGIRYVQNRQHETWWEDHEDDDDEYFEDEEDENYSGRSDIPIELRVRMGICRVYLGNVNLAARHFDYLLRYPATTYPDLHQDIAYAYMDKRHYDSALAVFQKIIDVSEEIEVDLLIRTAECYHEVGELDTAIIFYINVLEEQPDNLDVMMAMATVYEEQGKEEKALELVNHVMKKTREKRRKQKADEQKRIEESVSKTTGDRATKEKQTVGDKKSSLFNETSESSKSEYYRRRREERLRQEQEKNQHAHILFSKIDELSKSIGDEVVGIDRSVMREYMRAAEELWRDFTSTRAFYPSERSKRFQGFYATRTRKALEKSSLDREAYHLAHRLRQRVKANSSSANVDAEDELDEEEQEMKEEEERDLRMSAADHFRGFLFTKWMRVFIVYAYMLAQTRTAEKAYDMLKRVIEANVFYHDPQKKTTLKLVLLGCGIINRNVAIIGEVIKWLCQFYHFRFDALRMFSAAMSSGQDAAIGFTYYPILKYILRSIRIMDSIATQSNNTGASEADARNLTDLHKAIGGAEFDKILINEEGVKGLGDFYMGGQVSEAEEQAILNPATEALIKSNPMLLTVFAEQMSISKNFASASIFLLRAYAACQTDPLITLLLATSLLQKSMQRKVDDRHKNIIQGMLFLFEYSKLRNTNQESEYNIARAFHFLGLAHLAVPHYERVLVMPSAKYEGKIPEKNHDQIYVLNDDEEADEDDDTDLKREAAYNLHSIYMTSGSPALAQILLIKYCSI